MFHLENIYIIGTAELMSPLGISDRKDRCQLLNFLFDIFQNFSIFRKLTFVIQLIFTVYVCNGQENIVTLVKCQQVWRDYRKKNMAIVWLWMLNALKSSGFKWQSRTVQIKFRGACSMEPHIGSALDSFAANSWIQCSNFLTYLLTTL